MDVARWADLWGRLIALMASLGDLLAPAGDGSRPILYTTWREARAVLPQAERRLRHLLHLAAEVALPTMAPFRERAHRLAPPTPEPRDRGPASKPPFFFVVHRLAQPSAPPDGARKRRGIVDDQCGTLHVPADAEVRRFGALAVTIQSPGRAIHRLALILRRRRARRAAPLAFPAPPIETRRSQGNAPPGAHPPPDWPPTDWLPPGAHTLSGRSDSPQQDPSRREQGEPSGRADSPEPDPSRRERSEPSGRSHKNARSHNKQKTPAARGNRGPL